MQIFPSSRVEQARLLEETRVALNIKKLTLFPDCLEPFLATSIVEASLQFSRIQGRLSRVSGRLASQGQFLADRFVEFLFIVIPIL
jgi:hypothetical protein